MKRLPFFLLYLLLICPVSAAEIDLSDFAGGDSTTHSHTWVGKYDEDYHWQECQLCGAKQGETVHNLSTRYSISEDSCNPANQKILSCSGCAYVRSEKVNNSHGDSVFTARTYASAEPLNIYTLVKECQRCGTATQVLGTDLWTDSSGRPVDAGAATGPIDLYYDSRFFLKSLSP